MQLKYNYIFYLLLIISIIFLPFSIKTLAQNNITFNYNLLLNDFEISIIYNHIEDIFILKKQNSVEQLLFDNSGLCIYKFKIINVSKKIMIINGNLIVPEELVYELYNQFFIPYKNKALYDQWYDEYRKNLIKITFDNQNNDNKEDKQEKQNKEDDKNNENKEDNTDKNEKENKIIKDDTTQIKKEMITFYSFAQAKMVDFKVISFIVIDAGHGGEQPGAVNGKVYEKDINLKAALYLKKVLTAKFPYLNIYLTREKDITLSLEERVKFANKYLTETKTGIFISLHANANPYSAKKSGIEIYYLDYDVIDEKIKDLVKYENKEATESILTSIINRLLNEQLIFESSKLANYCYNAIKEVVTGINVNFYKGAPFYVLAYSEMPAILVEMGYITNPDDLKIMLSENFLNSLSQSLSKGIEQFIKEYTISEGFKKIQ